MDDAHLLERLWEGMRATFRIFAGGAPGSRFVELDGVEALVVPATPDRSVLNSVLYRDADRLARALDELAALYEEAGARAWTVWTHPGDAAAAEALERAGHRLDASPTAMALELDALTPSTLEGLDATAGGALDALLEINDAAHGWEETRPWTRALAGIASEDLRIYTADVDGAPACALMTIDHEGDAAVWLVATRQAAERRGLAGALLSRALVDGRERGCTTSTLQATRAGRPVYERLGYRSLGALDMWERRVRPS